MLRSDLEHLTEGWKNIEPYSDLYYYEQKIKQIAESYPKAFRDIVKEYNKVHEIQMNPITIKYLEKNPEKITENVQILKNSIELWYTAISSSIAVSPLLFHYSYICFNSFFIYSLFKWNPIRTDSHGLNFKLKEDLKDIKIIINKNGLFSRLLDVFTVFGVPLSFSKFIPIYNEDKIQFIENKNILQDENNTISVEDLIYFDSTENTTKFNIKENQWIYHSFFSNIPKASTTMNNIFVSFLIIFLASSIARYRPALWQTIIPADTKIHYDFMKKYREANMMYVIGDNQSSGLINRTHGLFSSIYSNLFSLNDWNRIHIISNYKH